MHRLTRLTNGFSRKLENLKAARFAHYNFVCLHSSVRITPALAAGISDRLWTPEGFVDRTSK
jgi:hypothetical protein